MFNRVAILTIVASALGLSGARADSVLVESPFLTGQDKSGAAAPTDGTAPELRGLMSSSGGLQVNIFDPSTKKSAWTTVNETGHAFVVRSVDLDHDAVSVVSADGRTFRLELKSAKTARAGSADENRGTGPPPQPQMMSGADQQARLQAIAEQVRARRQVRSLGLSPNGPNPAGPGLNQPRQQ